MNYLIKTKYLCVSRWNSSKLFDLYIGLWYIGFNFGRYGVSVGL